MTGITIVEPMLLESRLLTDTLHVKASKLGQVLATLSVCLASIGVGSTLSWSAPCLSELEDVNSTTTFHISPEEGSWVGSLLLIGALISAIPAGYCADQFGRKRSLITLTIPFIVSWGFIVYATNVWMLYVGRFLAGISAGAITVLVPMYISEVSEKSMRGPLCSLFTLSICIGLLLPFVFALFAELILLSAILAFIPFLFITSFLYMPESPIYLLKTLKQRQAVRSLQYFRGKHVDVQTELMNLKKRIDNSKVDKASLKDIWNNKQYFRCFVACTLLFLFRQLSGVIPVTFYTVAIFKASKSDLDPVIASILVAIVEVLATALVFFIIDKHGRKSYLLCTAAMNCLSLACLGMSFHLLHYQVMFTGLTMIPLASLLIFKSCFSIGVGPIPFVVLGELLTPEIVATISGIALMVNWLTAFLVTKMFGPMMIYLGPYMTFYILASFNALCALCVFFFVPETRGRTYQEIEDNWSG